MHPIPTHPQTLLLADLPEALLAELRSAAEQAYPEECCGLLIRDAGSQALCYWPCENIAPSGAAADRFTLAPQDWADAEDAGTVVAVVHSHPNASANPSSADRVSCERSGLTWFIVGWPSGMVVALQPEGWQAPLIGRDFHFGVLDCYTLIQDHFQRELGLTLPDFDREDDFWDRGQELYLENFAKAGFVPVAEGELRPHDVILMQVASSVTNHGAVYLGDGLMLHHLHGRLSCRDVYGGYWQRHTRLVVRHSSMVEVTP